MSRECKRNQFDRPSIGGMSAQAGNCNQTVTRTARRNCLNIGTVSFFVSPQTESANASHIKPQRRAIEKRLCIVLLCVVKIFTCPTSVLSNFTAIVSPSPMLYAIQLRREIVSHLLACITSLWQHDEISLLNAFLLWLSDDFHRMISQSKAFPFKYQRACVSDEHNWSSESNVS